MMFILVNVLPLRAYVLQLGRQDKGLKQEMLGRRAHVFVASNAPLEVVIVSVFILIQNSHVVFIDLLLQTLVVLLLVLNQEVSESKGLGCLLRVNNLVLIFLQYFRLFEWLVYHFYLPGLFRTRGCWIVVIASYLIIEVLQLYKILIFQHQKPILIWEIVFCGKLIV